MRNAAENHLTSLIGLYATFTLSPEYRTPRSNSRLIDHAPLSWGQLSIVLDCPLPTLQMTTFYYLMERFGRLAQPHQTGVFLSGSLAKSLRYCPQCLAEQSKPYYTLPWRFTFLAGCATHASMFLDVCPHCNKAIPLFIAPFKVGFCPLCGGDLRLGERRPLPAMEHERVQQLTEDLTFLLSPPEVPDTVSPSRTILSQQMALLQHAALRERSGLSSEGRSEIPTAWMTPQGYWQHDGSLLWYVRVLEAMGISFRTLFDAGVLREHALLLKAFSASPPAQQEIIPLLEELPIRIAHIQQSLQEQGLEITRQRIEDCLRLPLKLFMSYPEMQSIIAQIPQEIVPPVRERMAQQEADLLKQLPETLSRLEQEKRPHNLKELAQLLRMDARRLRKYPQITQFLQSHRDAQKLQRVARKAQREEELVRQTQAAIAQVLARGDAVTVEAICKLIGIKPATARTYPEVNALLAPIRAKRTGGNHQSRWEIFRQQRDAYLVTQLEIALQGLIVQRKPITLYALEKATRFDLHLAQKYPRTKALLDSLPQLALAQRAFDTPTIDPYEEQLLERLQAAILHLEASHEHITQTSLCRYLQIPMSHLDGRYPQARELMLQAKARTKHYPPKRVEQLYERVLTTIQKLEAAGRPVTRHAICTELQVSVYQVHRDPQVRILIEDILQRRDEAKRVRSANNEDVWIQRLQAAYMPLAIGQNLVTPARLYHALNTDARALKDYPRARAILNDLVMCHQATVQEAHAELIIVLRTRAYEMVNQLAAGTLHATEQATTRIHPRKGSAALDPKILMQREARDLDLSSQGQKAIQHLERTNQAITCKAVCKVTNWNYQTLTRVMYPRTRQLMQELQTRQGALRQSLRNQRERDLLSRVQQARKMFEAAGQAVTVKSIAKAVGLHPGSLRAYGLVKDELAHITRDNQRHYDQERQCQEQQLLVRIDAHLQQCREQGRPIIQTHISEELGISIATLLGYPRIKERFLQIRALQKQEI